jgi:parallel beta-helix repeat protein
MINPRTKTVLILSFICLSVYFSTSALATTYYVDATNGLDNNVGVSETTAWKTITKVNAKALQPGDQVLFKRGEIWRETLTIPSSGNASNFITFGAYGNGSNPVISGANPIAPNTSWAKVSDVSNNGNLWQTTPITTKPNVVMMSGHVGTKRCSVAELAAEYDWYWSGNVLYVYSTTDPYTAYKSIGVEIGQRQYCLTWKSKNYLSFQNIDFVAGNQYCIFMNGNTSNIVFDFCGLFKGYEDGINHNSLYNCSYVTLRNCTVAFNGAYGILATANTDHWTIHKNTVYNNGYTNEGSIVENTWGAGIKMVGTRGGGNCSNHVIEYNEVYFTGYKDNGTVRVFSIPNKGFGIWSDMIDAGNVSANGNIVRYNKVHNNADSGLFIEKSRYCSYYYNLSYSNGQYGLRVDADQNGPAVQDNYVYNNVLYNNLTGLYIAGGWAQDGNYVRDNIFRNNISSGNMVHQLLCKWGGENDGVMGSGNIYEYNSFGPEKLNFVQWGQGLLLSKYSSWNAFYGSDTHSVDLDPLLVDPVNADFRLQKTSPCIDAGIDVSLNRDYASNPVPFHNRVDLGALEYTSIISSPLKLKFVY